MPVAIAAGNSAAFVNLQPYARMAQCGRNISAAITADTAIANAANILLIGHASAIAKRRPACNLDIAPNPVKACRY
jgi:hypothetical protein